MGHVGAAWEITHFGLPSQFFLGRRASLRGLARQGNKNAATGVTGLEQDLGALVPHRRLPRTGIGVHPRRIPHLARVRRRIGNYPDSNAS